MSHQEALKKMQASGNDPSTAPRTESAGAWTWKLDRRPMVRRGGKLLLDGGLAALAWCLACGLLRPEPAPARGALLFAGLAMAVNAAFGLTGQHYRLVGLSEASALLRGSLTIAVAGLGFCALHGAARFGVAGADIFLPASLLTGGLWFGLRMLAMHLHHRRFRPRRAGRPGSERTLIVGAGRAGMLLCGGIARAPEAELPGAGLRGRRDGKAGGAGRRRARARAHPPAGYLHPRTAGDDGDPGHGRGPGRPDPRIEPQAPGPRGSG